MGPVSYSSSTKCTVAPEKRAPEAITALCTLNPYNPLPPKAGNRPGWMFSMASLYSLTRAAGINCRRHEACQPAPSPRHTDAVQSIASLAAADLLPACFHEH